MNTGSISVLIPVYNPGRFLRDAIASILAQTHRDLELIAVNDGSTDDSAKTLASFAATDSRVRVISRANTGIVGALNDGLAIAGGDFIARMDADDIAEPERLHKQLDYLLSNPDCVAIGTGFLQIDHHGAKVDRHIPPTTHEAIEARLLTGDGSALQHPTLLARASALRAVGGYDRGFDKAEDLDLYFRLMPLGRLANLPEPLLRYRVHTGSTNFRHRMTQKQVVLKILSREKEARKIPADSQPSPQGPADLPVAVRDRHWACTSCLHGTWPTACRYALRALTRDPASRDSWRTLRYVWSRRNSTPWRETAITVTQPPAP